MDDERLKAAARADGKDGFYRYASFGEIGDLEREGWRTVDRFDGSHHQYHSVVLMWLPCDDATDDEPVDT